MPFRNSKTLKIELSNYGSYLGRDAGCFEVRSKNGKVEHYPHFEKEIGECVLKSGSCVSTDALIDLALWNIDTYIMTKRNRGVAVLKNLEDDSHVKTRVCQYQALENAKGIEIAKQIVKSKIEGQNRVLKKYGLRLFDSAIGDIETEKGFWLLRAEAQDYISAKYSSYFQKRSDLKAEKRTKLMMD